MKRPAAPQFGGAAGFLCSERQSARLSEDGQQRAADPTALPIELHPIPQRPSHARSAGSGARGLASNLQNNLDGSHNCGRAPTGGTLSAAAGLRLPNFRAPSEKTPAFGRNLPERANSRPGVSFFFWTVHGPFSFFSTSGEKRKWGVQMHQPSSWLKSTPPVRARKSPPASRRGDR